MIILATISINAVLGENGIIKRAEQARQHQLNAEASDREALESFDQQIASKLPFNIDELEKGPSGKPLVTEVTRADHDKITAEDTLGNIITVPGGFKIAEDSGSTVKEGIVVEDEEGNQFVWIPVSNIDGDNSADGTEENLITIENEDGTTSEVEITLGRYTFARTQNAETGLYEDGTPTIVQKGLDYASIVTINNYYQELSTFRESNQVKDTTGTNATAKDLAGFIESVEKNHGYYLARYEASYSSGSVFGVGNDETYYKPASKRSTRAINYPWTPSTAEGSSTVGYLWNYTTQGNASKVCRQMYYGNKYVESDLCNSYAWDTAIVYIQAMGNSNYANKTDGNGTLNNTGSTGDEKCKIFDIAGNCYEWTTEYCSNVMGNYANCCNYRGAYYYHADLYTCKRNSLIATTKADYCSFRVALYIK